MTLKFFAQDTLKQSNTAAQRNRSRPQRAASESNGTSATNPSAARMHANAQHQLNSDANNPNAQKYSSSSPSDIVQYEQAEIPAPVSTQPLLGTSSTQKTPPPQADPAESGNIIVEKDVLWRRRRDSLLRPILNRTPVSQSEKIKEILNSPGFKKKRKPRAQPGTEEPTSATSSSSDDTQQHPTEA